MRQLGSVTAWALIYQEGGEQQFTCCSLTGVGAIASACTEMYVGSLRLRRARSLTDLVWVAENSIVWRCRGRFSMIAFTEAEKPCAPQQVSQWAISLLVIKMLESIQRGRQSDGHVCLHLLNLDTTPQGWKTR